MKRVALMLFTLILAISFVQAANFVVTRVNDGLDWNDMTIMENGLKSMGYTLSKKNNNVSKSSLKTYLGTNYTTIYHTGHGNSGSIACSNGTLSYTSITLKCQNTFFATCLTLVPTGWKSRFGTTANCVMGYTNYSYDYTDDTIANTVITQLKGGKSYPVAWYYANNNISSVRDRWCIYARSGSSIVEYSARTGSHPRTPMPTDMVPMDTHQTVWVSEKLMDPTTRRIAAFNEGFIAQNASHKTVSSVKDFNAIQDETPLTPAQAIAVVQRKVKLPKDAVLDGVLNLQARDENDEKGFTIGHIVSYRREIAGVPVRSNSFEDHMVFVVDANEQIVMKSIYWPNVKKVKRSSSEKIMSVAEAINIAAPEIANRTKHASGKIYFTNVMPVYGTEGVYSKSRSLVPSYALISTQGDVVVINALTGKILK